MVCLLTGIADRLYIDFDNFWVSIVSNNVLAPNSINQNLHPLLSRAITILQPLLPTADWFALLSRAGIVLAFWLIGYLLAVGVAPLPRRVALYCVLILALYRHSLFNKNYTIYSALFAAAGAAALLLALRQPRGHWLPWLGAAFIALGILWRAKGAALVVPFLLLDIAFLLLGKRLTLKHLAQVLLPAVLCAAFLVGYMGWFYSRTPYRESKAFDNARVTLVDFAVKPWGEVADTLTPAGFTENDYTCLYSWLYTDPEVFTLDKMELAAQAAPPKNLHFPPQGCAGCWPTLRSPTGKGLCQVFSCCSVPWHWHHFGCCPAAGQPGWKACWPAAAGR